MDTLRRSALDERGAAMVEFRALGGVSVIGGDRELNLGGPRQRRLLALLLIHRGTVVSTDRVVDAVFAGVPTPAATTTLRSYVARLRKVLDEAGAGGSATLTTQAPGYVFRVVDDAFDVARFERGITEGRSRLSGDDPGGAAVVLRDALGLWSGEPYAEFADEDWAQPESQRLVELHGAALESLFEAELRCGRAAPIVPELETAVAAQPLREGLRAQLMLALYRSGRQADALRSFRDHRELLIEELGLDPAPALCELEERILGHDPSLLLTDPSGTALRGYRLGERLGSGADGTVHAGHLPGVDRDIVIRVVRPELADRPAFVRSFDATMQRVAALAHPAVVTVHDHWREPGAAYVVLRRLRGGSLADRSERQELTDGVVAAVVRRVGGALAAAHEAGVVHGRVTARSVLFDERGEPYLGDFALAVSDEGPSTGDDVSAFVDLVRSCLDGDGVAALGSALEAAPGTPIAAVVDALERRLGEAEDRVPPAINPYKGLQAFDEVDAADFFGRDRVVGTLVDRLADGDHPARLLLLVGGSGTGKSSVVHAGLIPRIRSGAVPSSAQWLVTTMVPGSEPFKNLAEALRRVAVASDGGLERTLAAEGDLAHAVSRLLPDGAELLVVIDQFEELFTSASERDQRRFLEAVAAAVTDPDARLRVVGTLRADFYDRPLAFHRFGALVNDATVTIPAMGPAEIEAAIVGPAARAGRAVEGALVAELVDAVVDEPGGLPALQFSLYELAERSTGTLLVADHHALGGVDGAIAGRAEQLHRSLTDEERAIVRQLFERLVHLGADGVATSRRVARTELAEILDGPIDSMVDRWAEARLLSVDRDERSRVPTVELAHEALLREWPRLRRWIAKDRDALVALGHLRAAAAEWAELDRDPGALYRGARLSVVDEILRHGDRSLSAVEQEFLVASVAARADEERAAVQQAERQVRANRRLRVQLGIIGVALVVALIGGFVAVDQRRTADRARRVATSRELAAAADANLESDAERSMLLALAAVEATRDHDGTIRPEALEALHRALAADRIELSVPDLGGALDWSPDGSVFVTEGPEESGLVDIRDATTGESVIAFPGNDVDINDVAFSADGSMLATTGDDGALRVWDPATGDELMAARFGDDEVWAPSFSRDGTRVAAGWLGAGVARVLDVATGAVVAEVQDAPVLGSSFNADGTRLAISGPDGFPTSIVDVATSEIVGRLGDGSTDLVRDVEYSPDGRTIATAEGDARVRRWDATTFELIDVIGGHATAVNGLAWSPDGSRLATVSDDGTALVFDLGVGGATESIRLAARDTRNGLADVDFSPDGERIMTGDWALESVKIWDVTSGGGAELTTIGSIPYTRGSPAFLPDGSALVVSTPDGGLSLHGVDDGMLIRRFDTRPMEGEDLTRVALSPDGTTIAGGVTLPVHLWDVSTGEHLGVVGEESSEATYIVDLAWSPDSRELAVSEAGDGGSVGVYDRSGREMARLDPPGDLFIRSVRFTVEGDELVTTKASPRNDPAEEGSLVWDWRAGEVIGTFVEQSGQLAVDPRGGRVVTSRTLEGSADVWDVATGEPSQTLRSSAPIYGIAFRSDGRQVATGGADDAIRLWDPDSGRQQLVLQGHRAAVGTVAYAPDGRRLASVDEAGLVRVWTLDPDELIEIARRRVTRGLDDDECRQYLHRSSCAA